MKKIIMIVLGLAWTMSAHTLYANDDFAPSWRGLPGSVSVIYNFDTAEVGTTSPSSVTGPDSGSVTSISEGEPFGEELCVDTRTGIVAFDFGRILTTNLAGADEAVLVRVQVTLALEEFPFMGIELATGVFPEIETFCGGFEGLELVGEPVDHGDGFFTYGAEVIFDEGDLSLCDDVQVFMEAAGVCVDEIIIDIQHGCAPGQSAVVSLDKSSLELTESASANSDTLALSLSGAAPTGSVIVTLGDAGLTDITIDGGTSAILTFSGATWADPQTVTIAASDDTNFEDCVESIVLQASVTSSDSAYEGGVSCPLTVDVIDNNTGCIFVGGEPELVELESNTATLVYSVNKSPSGAVVVDINDGFEGDPLFTADPNTVTFDNSNWTTPQTVTLTVVQDEEFHGEEAGVGAITETTALTGLILSGDSSFTDPPEAVLVLITEDECEASEFNPMDFNGNCNVDTVDFSIFVEQWLNCTDPEGGNCSAVEEEE